MGTFWEKIFDETKAVPMTLILLMGSYVAVGYLMRDHVSQEDLASLKQSMATLDARVDGVKQQLRFDHIDSEIHKVESDLFNIQLHKTELLEAHKPIDPVLLQRLDELSNRHADLLRQIEHTSTDVRQ